MGDNPGGELPHLAAISAWTGPCVTCGTHCHAPMCGRDSHPESAASKRCFPYKAWLTVRATGDNFNAVRKREFGVAAADVPQVVLEVVQQVNHGASDRHVE